jgi:hypothetical protein
MSKQSEPPPRQTIEEPEYTAQYDDIVNTHSLEVIGPVLAGLTEGIARNPRASDHVTGRIWMLRSKSLGLTIPTFTIFFSIEGDGVGAETILFLWIEENRATDEVRGS